MSTRALIAATVASLALLAPVGVAARGLSPRARAVAIIVAKPKLCGEVHATIRRYGYREAESGFELVFAEHPAFGTPAVFRWVVKLC